MVNPLLLLSNQFIFMMGFYMVVPFLAAFMRDDLALESVAIGLVLGIRTFSQQGLFIVGGAFADRLGPRRLILLGCAVRVVGFVVLGVSRDFATVLLGACLTGFAGALFSPAISSLAASTGEARSSQGKETRAHFFARMAVWGELGAIVGPLAGAPLLGNGSRPWRWAAQRFSPRLAAQLADTKVVGEELAPELETIAALQPDLILGNKKRHENIYDQLSAIAPTVFVENITGQWKDNIKVYADASGSNAEADAALADYARRVAAIKEALGERNTEVVGLLRFIAGQNYAYNNDSFPGSILRDIGFGRPAAQDKPGLAEKITMERIPELDGDRLLHFSYEIGHGGATKEAETWMASPLWAELKAAKANHVYTVSDTVWATAGGIMAANLAPDDIEKIYGIASTR